MVCDDHGMCWNSRPSYQLQYIYYFILFNTSGIYLSIQPVKMKSWRWSCNQNSCYYKMQFLKGFTILRSFFPWNSSTISSGRILDAPPYTNSLNPFQVLIHALLKSQICLYYTILFETIDLLSKCKKGRKAVNCIQRDFTLPKRSEIKWNCYSTLYLSDRWRFMIPYNALSSNYIIKQVGIMNIILSLEELIVWWT